VSPDESDRGVTFIEWSLDRPDSVEYDFAIGDLARDVVDGVPAVLTDLPAPDPDVGLESLVAARYGPEVSAANVLVTAGATSANALLTADVVARAAERGAAPTVLTERPGYEPLSATPRALGADVAHFGRSPETDYAVPVKAVRGAIDDDVCLVSTTNRHNPSGRLLSRDTLESLAEAVAATGAVLLVDEVYAPFVDDPLTGNGTAFGGPTAAGAPSTAVSNSLTKFLGLDALRLGWLVADPGAVERLSSMRTHLLDVSRTSRYFGRVALHNAETLAERSRRVLRENAALLAEFVDDREDLCGIVDPTHSTAFLSHDSADGDAVAEAALSEGIRVCPGRFFGADSRFRLSLSREPSRMAEGLRAFHGVLDSLG